jgi:hypothetical protein
MSVNPIESDEWAEPQYQPGITAKDLPVTGARKISVRVLIRNKSEKMLKVIVPTFADVYIYKDVLSRVLHDIGPLFGEFISKIIIRTSHSGPRGEIILDADTQIHHGFNAKYQLFCLKNSEDGKFATDYVQWLPAFRIWKEDYDRDLLATIDQELARTRVSTTVESSSNCQLFAKIAEIRKCKAKLDDLKTKAKAADDETAAAGYAVAKARVVYDNACLAQRDIDREVRHAITENTAKLAELQALM